MNPCQDETVLSAFLDDELSQHQWQIVREHVESCKACRQLLADLKKADNALHDLDGMTPSADFERTFWSKVDDLEASRRRHWWHHWKQPVWRPALATGLAAGLVIGMFFITRPDKTVTMEERIIAENIELLENYDLINNLELLENWDAIDAMKELS